MLIKKIAWTTRNAWFMSNMLSIIYVFMVPIWLYIWIVCHQLSCKITSYHSCFHYISFLKNSTIRNLFYVNGHDSPFRYLIVHASFHTYIWQHKWNNWHKMQNYLVIQVSRKFVPWGLVNMRQSIFPGDINPGLCRHTSLIGNKGFSNTNIQLSYLISYFFYPRSM